MSFLKLIEEMVGKEYFDKDTFIVPSKFNANQTKQPNSNKINFSCQAQPNSNKICHKDA